MIVLLIVSLLILIILINKGYQILYFVPLLLQLSEILKIFNAEGPAAPESIMMDYMIIIFSSAICLIVIIKNFKVVNKHSFGILILLLYLSLQILYSSDLWNSFKRLLGFNLPFLLFIGAFIITKDHKNIQLLIKTNIWLVTLFIINVFIATYYKLDIEYEDYGIKFVNLGSVNFFIVYNFVFAIILLPTAYLIEKVTIRKYFILIIYFIGFIILILLLKRTYVYLVIVGLASVLLFQATKRNLRYVITIMIFGIIAFFFSDDYITHAFLTRENVIKRNINEEGRYLELALYPEIISKSKDPINALLFGREFLNSEGKFIYYEKIFGEKNRLFHTDIGVVLYGAGILGLFLFLRVLYLIARKFIYLKNRLNKELIININKNVPSAFLIMYICIIFSLFSDGITVANNRVLPYLVLGSILGIMNNTIKMREFKSLKV